MVPKNSTTHTAAAGSLPWASAAQPCAWSTGRPTVGRRDSLQPPPADADLSSDFGPKESRLSCAMSRYTKLRYEMVLLLDDPFDKCIAKVFSAIFMLAISIGVLIACLEQFVPDLALEPCEFMICVIYTLEVGLRLWCSPHPCSFLSDWHNLVDTTNMLEIWCVLAIPEAIWIQWPMMDNMRSFEVALRLSKLCRYSSSWQLLCATLVDAAPALLLPLGAWLVLVALGAGLLLAVEEGASSMESLTDDARALTSIFDAMVFCMICLTSHEPGPYYGFEVRSKLGHAIVGLLMLCGHVILAMPIAIVGTCFCRTWFQRDRILFADLTRRRLKWQGKGASETLRRLFNKFDRRGEGLLGLREFRRFIGAITPNPSAAKVLALFSIFDQDQDGVVSFEELHEAIYPNSDLDVLELHPVSADADGVGEDECAAQAAHSEDAQGDQISEEDPLTHVSRILENFERHVLETFEQRLRISRRQSIEQACKPLTARMSPPFTSRVSTPHAARSQLATPTNLWTSTQSFPSNTSEGSADSDEGKGADKEGVDKSSTRPKALSTIPSTMAAAQRARRELSSPGAAAMEADKNIPTVSSIPSSSPELRDTPDQHSILKPTDDQPKKGAIAKTAESERLRRSFSSPSSLSFSDTSGIDWEPLKSQSQEFRRSSILSWPSSFKSPNSFRNSMMQHLSSVDTIGSETRAPAQSGSLQPPGTVRDDGQCGDWAKCSSAPVSAAQSSHDKWVAPSQGDAKQGWRSRRWGLFDAGSSIKVLGASK